MNRTFQKTKRTVSRIPWRGKSGQALIEFAVVATMLIVLIFGVIDFCRAIYLRQVLVNLSRETANLEARGSGATTTDIMTNALNAAILEALPLALNSSTGMVIVTAVTNLSTSSTGFAISQQYFMGSLSGAKSMVGTFVSTNKFSIAKLPTTGGTYLPANRTVYVAEIYYKFVPITPVGNIIFKAVLPAQFYDAAYFSAL
jgi:Flp pilus assembly protein TadG